MWRQADGQLAADPALKAAVAAAAQFEIDRLQMSIMRLAQQVPARLPAQLVFECQAEMD
jgi:uncharacterized protein YfcZ (UPF0381/DUF406 family)